MAKKELNIDISSNFLVPVHELVSEEEKALVIEKYGPLSQFPQISITDPAIRGMNAKEGDLIKILRKSHTSGAHIFYRRVVK